MFKLLRYFSIISLIAFVIVIALLTIFYRQIVLANLIALEENKNVALTQAFSNSLWPEFSTFLTSTVGLKGDELRTHAGTAKLHQAVLIQMNDLAVVKVKVYNLEGLTVFSTEASQIGEDKSTNPGFLSARLGQVVTVLTHKDTVNTFEGTTEDRDVLESYMPIRRSGATGPIEGVFEIYSDVTPLLAKIERTQTDVLIGVTLILVCLYVILFIIVRRADRIMQRQHIEHQQGEEALQKTKDELEIRVVERTIELKEANERLHLELAERKRAETLVQASLKEKEVLLKEIHHRVKNNLQIISSLLYLQSKKIKDERTLEMFQESQNRVKSMALIHEKLYQSPDLARVDFAEYVRNLTSYLHRLYNPNIGVIKLKINVEDILLDIDMALPCGLIINELVSNALKYAFPAGELDDPPGGPEDEIRIELRVDSDNDLPTTPGDSKEPASHNLTLIVADNGVGLPQNLDFHNVESLGLQLVNSLVNQLDGAIELHRNGGTQFELKFTA